MAMVVGWSPVHVMGREWWTLLLLVFHVVCRTMRSNLKKRKDRTERKREICWWKDLRDTVLQVQTGRGDGFVWSRRCLFCVYETWVFCFQFLLLGYLLLPNKRRNFSSKRKRKIMYDCLPAAARTVLEAAFFNSLVCHSRVCKIGMYLCGLLRTYRIFFSFPWNYFWLVRGLYNIILRTEFFQVRIDK